jgi:hypothetical protein
VIQLPRHVAGMVDACIPAAVTMVCMYWRGKRPELVWNLPDDVNSSEWDDFFEEGRRLVRQAGLSEGSLKEYLGELNVPLAVKYQQLFGLDGLFRMLNDDCPPIPVFDRSFMFLGTPSYGHAAVVIDRTKELLVLIDPANYPKFRAEYSMREFLEAWKRRSNLAIVIYPEDAPVQFTSVPSTLKTLTDFFGGDKV